MSHLSTREQNDVMVVDFNFEGDRLIDELVIQELGDELSELIRSSKLKKVLLDFSVVKSMSSAMLGKLNMLRQQAIKEKVDLRLCGLSDNIQEVFSQMKLDQILDIYPTVSDAMHGFEKRKKRWYA